MSPMQVSTVPSVEPAGVAALNPETQAENGNMSCTNNCEDKALLYVDTAAACGKAETVACDTEVDVVGFVDNGSVPDCSGDDPDATELSSSFDGTFSGSEDGLRHDFSDAEVESEFNGSFPFINTYNRLFRKKKVTDHWRKFIQPLTWRCRWLELRMKELRSQAAKYDRELAVYDHEKQLQAAMTSSDKSVAREVPWICRNRIKPMKRRKRKKNEDTTDVSSYMAHHIIFTYYDKKLEADGLFIEDGNGHQAEQATPGHDALGINFDWPMLNIRDNEKSLEQILLDIEVLQSRIVEMKTQLSLCNNVGDIFTTPSVFVQGGPSYRSSPSPRCSPGSNEDALAFEADNTPPSVTGFENDEMAMPGSTVSSFGDAAHPDIIESTVDLLSSGINLSRGQHQIGNLGNEVADDILINNRAADELHNFEKAGRPAEKPQDTVKEEEDESFPCKASSSETETDIEIAPVAKHPVMKRCTNAETNLRRSKRKRKLRRTSPGSWNGEKRRRRKQSKKQENS